jgi:hypothetical protein
LFMSDFGIHFGPTSYAVSPGQSRSYLRLAIYSWKARGIQEAPFVTQLPLCHPAPGMIAYTVAWEVSFRRPHSEGTHLRAPPCV